MADRLSTEQLAIGLEDLGNLRRMHAQQVKRFVNIKNEPDPQAVLNDVVFAHMLIPDLYDMIEALLTERLAASEAPR